MSEQRVTYRIRMRYDPAGPTPSIPSITPETRPQSMPFGMSCAFMFQMQTDMTRLLSSGIVTPYPDFDATKPPDSDLVYECEIIAAPERVSVKGAFSRPFASVLEASLLYYVLAADFLSYHQKTVMLMMAQSSGPSLVGAGKNG